MRAAPAGIVRGSLNDWLRVSLRTPSEHTCVHAAALSAYTLPAPPEVLSVRTNGPQGTMALATPLPRPKPGAAHETGVALYHLSSAEEEEERQ